MPTTCNINGREFIPSMGFSFPGIQEWTQWFSGTREFCKVWHLGLGGHRQYRARAVLIVAYVSKTLRRYWSIAVRRSAVFDHWIIMLPYRGVGRGVMGCQNTPSAEVWSSFWTLRNNAGLLLICWNASVQCCNDVLFFANKSRPVGCIVMLFIFSCAKAYLKSVLLLVSFISRSTFTARVETSSLSSPAFGWSWLL